MFALYYIKRYVFYTYTSYYLKIMYRLEYKAWEKYGFPHYLKVEFSYEIFCKVKWHKAKKGITIL